MNGESTRGIEDIIRRNAAALRSKANLTQQALADEMLLRGIAWTRETVAQVETTNRRLGFTEAIALAACLDVPVARLAATGAAAVAVGQSEWTTAYLGAAIAGTTGDIFPPESYASHPSRPVEPAAAAAPPSAPIPPDWAPERRGGLSEKRLAGAPSDEAHGRRATDVPEQTQQKTAERIERRLRLRVTAGDVDNTAQRLWSRSLESERERRVTDRQALTGGSLKTIRGHVSRDLDRELAHEMEQRTEVIAAAPDRPAGLSPDDAAWEATRLNILLANKGYEDSDVTRWWNFARHRELGGQTVAEAWKAGGYEPVARLIESLPNKRATGEDFLIDG
jgi:transcriptional regulator with XRE-family HTH domain